MRKFSSWTIVLIATVTLGLLPVHASEGEADESTRSEGSSEPSAQDETPAEKDDEDPFFLNDPTMTEREPRPQAKDRLFPLWKKVAGDYALPRPWAVSALNFWQVQDYFVRDVEIQIGSFPPISAEDLQNVEVDIDARSTAIKGSLWILPFLNLHGSVGYTNVDSVIKLIDIPLEPPTPGPGEPTRGDKVLNLGFDGPTYSGGFTVTGGYKRWWGSLTATIAFSRLEATVDGIGENDFTTELVLPKVGYHFEGVNVWLGARWMHDEQRHTGSLDGFSFDVLVEQNSWSPTVGMHALLGEHWELTVEGGFEPRRSAMFMLGYRF